MGVAKGGKGADGGVVSQLWRLPGLHKPKTIADSGQIPHVRKTTRPPSAAATGAAAAVTAATVVLVAVATAVASGF